jgi:hypothetical protein
MTVDYASPPTRRPVVPPVRIVAGLLLAVVGVAALLGFAWLQFEVSNEYRWLATNPFRTPYAYADYGVSPWRTDGDGATVRDVWVRRTLFVARLQQVYNPEYDDGSRPPRNHRVEYRPAFWLVVAGFAVAFAANVAIVLRNRVPRPAVVEGRLQGQGE